VGDWLTDQVVLITGAGSGMGRAVVDRFLEEGAHIGILELVPAKVEALKNELDPERTHVLQGNAASWDDNARAVAETVERFGKLDVFIANAGIFDGNAHLKDIAAEDLGRAFDELYAVNVRGPILGAKAALPELVKTEGTMLFTCSFASYHPAGGGLLYTSSKHALLGVVQELAYELAPKVRVVGVAPGACMTVMHGVSALGQTTMPSLIEGNEKYLPVNFLPYPEDYAATYLFLASKKNSRVMTGTVINAYNGLHIRGTGQLVGGADL